MELHYLKVLLQQPDRSSSDRDLLYANALGFWIPIWVEYFLAGSLCLRRVQIFRDRGHPFVLLDSQGALDAPIRNQPDQCDPDVDRLGEPLIEECQGNSSGVEHDR